MSIEANGRSVTSLSVRIRREHTRGLERRTGLGDGGLNRLGVEKGEGVRASRKGGCGWLDLGSIRCKKDTGRTQPIVKKV